MGGTSFLLYRAGTDLDTIVIEAVKADHHEHGIHEGSIGQKARCVSWPDQAPMSRTQAEALALDMIRKNVPEGVGDHYSTVCAALPIAGPDGALVGFLLFGVANE
jgi:hypothetical protein